MTVTFCKMYRTIQAIAISNSNQTSTEMVNGVRDKYHKSIHFVEWQVLFSNFPVFR